MREIKFRAWDSELKFMVDPSGGYFVELDGDVWFNLGTGNGHDNLLNQFEKLVLMQYTGLKDSTGTEVYEGDIVSYDEMAFTVSYEEQGACFALDDGTTRYTPLFRVDTSFYEVIGNIYENPELLAQSNEK